MGTSIATELMARDLRGELSIGITGALLFNGSMLLHLAKPTIGQRMLRSRLGPLFARLTSERTFRAQFARIFAPEHPLTAEEAAHASPALYAQWLRAPGGLTAPGGEALAAVADRHGAIVVDLYAASRREVPRRPELLALDGYHPSDLGYARWAELMWEAVRTRIKS